MNKISNSKKNFAVVYSSAPIIGFFVVTDEGTKIAIFFHILTFNLEKNFRIYFCDKCLMASTL